MTQNFINIDAYAEMVSGATTSRNNVEDLRTTLDSAMRSAQDTVSPGNYVDGVPLGPLEEISHKLVDWKAWLEVRLDLARAIAAQMIPDFDGVTTPRGLWSPLTSH